MNLLGTAFEQEEIDAVCARFPDFQGAVPDDAKYWTPSDLELFLGSNGQLRPRGTAKASIQTCPLLTRIRLKLAEERVDEATSEYQSFCRHLRERSEVCSLPGAAACTQALRAKTCPDALRAPVVIERPPLFKARDWTMEYWKRECSDEVWMCCARTPRFGHERSGADSFAVESSIAEYVDYVRVLSKMDPSCSEENRIAYFRAYLHGWAPFTGPARRVFEGCWRDLVPPGVQDFTARWLAIFASMFNMDWLELLARYYKVCIGPSGVISRLRTERHGAHIMLTQVEGRSLVFMFSPEDAAGLYGKVSSDDEALEAISMPAGNSFVASAAHSPVDIFFPNSRRHPRFAETSAQVAVLAVGESLIVPSGWWRYTVALEPSVVLEHPFWNLQNRHFFSSELQAATFDYSKMPPELREVAARNFSIIHETIMEDDSDVDS
mmetsp:Transcript_34687/g.64253  ORF Transcript_34687/g.64253 Transcript_34687/m.64253 type:complete len:437 (-) Transcript_34687:7-1317(-)